MNGISLFSGGGISETYFKEIGIDIKVANELLPERSSFYQSIYPETKMIAGDITELSIYNSVINEAKSHNVEFMIATPPCQGMSTLGKREYSSDKRNSLFKYVINAINDLQPDYVFIENVPKFLDIYFNKDGTTYTGVEKEMPLHINEVLHNLYESEYKIDVKLLNAKNYSVPQSRPRAIIKMYKKNLSWDWPEASKDIITLRDAIGDLPSLWPGETSTIKWHHAIKHNERQIEAMLHTSEGRSALLNEIYYPKKKDGSRVKGFHNTYKRMTWDSPAPARATNNHLISGHNNVHPGRQMSSGLQSDPRVLSFRELIIVSSLPLDWNIPDNFKETIIRQMIGEAIPPLLSKKVVEMIFK